MNIMNLVTISSVLAACSLAVPQANAQSVRCIMEHFVSETEISDQPVSYAMLDNGTLAALHVPAAFGELPEIRLYDLNGGDEFTLRGTYPLAMGSSNTVLSAHNNDLYVCVEATNPDNSPYELNIINVSDPDHPELRTSLPVSYNLRLADFVGNTAYFMNDDGDPGNSYYHVYDITDPNSPILRRLVNMGIVARQTQGMQVGGGLLHVSATDRRLLTYATDEFGQTTWLHTIPPQASDVRSMEAYQNALYIQRNGTFQVFDYTDPVNPVMTYETDTHFSNSSIRIDGEYAYLIGDDITVLDISNPAYPIESSAFTDYAYITDFVVQAGKAIVVRGTEASLYNATVRENGRPQEVRTPTGAESNEMVIRNGLGYIANGNGGVAIYNVADPMSPQLINTMPTSSEVTNVAINDDHLFTVTGDSIDIYSLIVPTDPSLDSSIPQETYVVDISVTNSILAAVAYGGGEQSMVLYDISDPASPTLQSETSGFITVAWVEIEGNTVFVYDSSIPFGAQYTGLTAFDIADPTNPVFADKLVVAQLGRAAYQDGYLYVCADDAVSFSEHSILVYDVSDPYNTSLAAEIPTGRRPFEIAIDGNQLAVAGNWLSLYDISNPLDPARAGSAPRLLDVSAVRPLKPHFVGDSILATQADIGLVSFDASHCGECPIDLNNDNALDFFDVSIFLTDYIAQRPSADLNKDGMHNFFDVSEFLVQFHGGCP